MILLRHELGEVLREIRQDQGRTLRDVATSSSVSLGYLSELERGTKEASSELLAAVCGGLGLTLSEVLGHLDLLTNAGRARELRQEGRSLFEAVPASPS